MDLFTVIIVVSALLVLFLGGGVWIGVSLFMVGLLGLALFTELPVTTILANIVWNQVSSSTMMSLPLFVFMGEILFRSKISENLFRGLSPWMDAIPGRLFHVNVFACTLFAAVSGSSAATTATVGKIVLPELDKRGYDRKLAIGSLAGSGSIGFMIPPSMMMLVYGIMADVSIGQLFIAGIIPGILTALIFSAYIAIECLIHHDYAPRGRSEYTWKDRIRGIPLLAPALGLVAAVLGSIYAGWATPTEAAAVGVTGALIIAALLRSLSWDVFKTALRSAVKTACMIMWIVCGAAYFSVALGYLGVARSLTQFIGDLGLSPYFLIAILSAMYLFLGCLLDGFSMIVMSLPIALPLIRLAGFDPLWFGIYLVLMIQLAQITPPVGFNLFIINGLVEEDIVKISVYTLPFFFLLFLVTMLITLYPQIVLFLPRQMIG